jgi:CoA:oxalate CoA-transferase
VPEAPLTGVVVVELTAALAGPYGAMLLADMGATVIKVEGPTGDEARDIPPYFVGEDSAYFASVNRNKRSIGIDAKTPAGRRLMYDLVARADVFLTNLRPRAVEGLGLDHACLAAIRPGLIYAHITGYGSQIADPNMPAFDLTVQAIGGTMSVTGEAGGPPCRAGLPMGDLNAGMFAALAVSGALFRRQQTGEGAHLDISMLGGQLAYTTYLAAYSSFDAPVGKRYGAGHGSSVPYNRYLCADDRWIVVAAQYEGFYRKLLKALDAEHLGRDARFTTRRDRAQHKEELDHILADLFRQHPRDRWLAALREADVPAGAVNDVGEALRSKEVRDAALVTEIRYPGVGSLRAAANPMKYVGEGESGYQPAPTFSQDHQWVLDEFLAVPAQRRDALLDGATVVARRGTKN